MPRPTLQELYQDIETDARIRTRERRRLIHVHQQRTRPRLVQWGLDGGLLLVLYGLGFAGAQTYWATLRLMWGQEYVFTFAPLGHAIPAFLVGTQTGVLFSRGRFFFVWGPLLVAAATFIREVWVPWGAADALRYPLWLYWAACAEALVASIAALLLGAWIGRGIVE